MSNFSRDQIAHGATILVNIAACAADPSGISAAQAATGTYFSVRDLFSSRSDDLMTLTEAMAHRLRQSLENPGFHMPADGPVLLPQMLEAALPEPSAIAGAGLNAPTLTERLRVGLTRHHDTAYRRQELLEAFANWVGPELPTLLDDADFVKSIGPTLFRDLYNRQRQQAARLQEMADAYGSLSNALDALNQAGQDQLVALASQFDIERPYRFTPPDLRHELEKRAQDYRAYKSQIETIDEADSALGNLKAAAENALERFDFEEVIEILSTVHLEELEAAARTASLKAGAHLQIGQEEQAYRVLDAAAESFRAINDETPARKRLVFQDMLYQRGLRYGGSGLALARQMIVSALRDLSKDRSPVLWAFGKNYLAIALQTQGERTAGPEGAALLAEAVAAYREALTVSTRKDHPVDWATIQQNLGNALANQSNRTDGPKGAALLAEAVAAYRDALTVRTPADHPVHWATTQQNLGIAFETQGSRTAGPEGAALLAEAVAAYREALTVSTREDHPVDWALTTENIAIAEVAIADHDTTSDPRPHLEAALHHVEAALTVFDPEHMPFNYEKAAKLRDHIKTRLDTPDD